MAYKSKIVRVMYYLKNGVPPSKSKNFNDW